MENNTEMLLKVIIKKINDLEKNFNDCGDLLKEVQKQNKLIYKPFDPTPHIKQPLDRFTKAYKYKGNIYIKLSDLYEVLAIDNAVKVEKSTFTRNYGSKTGYEWRNLSVNIVYLATMKMDNGRLYYISTDGIFYSSTLEEVPYYGEYKNAIRLMDNGNYGLYYAGEYVMFKFINPDYVGNKVFFIDGDFSNCRIDNIAALNS